MEQHWSKHEPVQQKMNTGHSRCESRPRTSERAGSGQSRAEPEVDAVMKRIREACLRRGAASIKNIGRTFRLFDDDRSGTVSQTELRNGLADYGVNLTEDDLNLVFDAFDQDDNGTVCYDELIEKIRPPMSKCRTDLIDKAFQTLDTSGDGEITTDELVAKYSVTQHPKFKTGEKTKEEILKEFLNQYEGGVKDNKVTQEEFRSYYAGVSASIDKDVYFDFMMRQCWKL